MAIQEAFHMTMGEDSLQFWSPSGIGQDPPSESIKNLTLRTKEGNSLSIPVYTNTKVREVKALLEAKLGLDEGKLQFVVKQGCSHRKNVDWEEIGRDVLVTGIRSFIRERKEYDHPHVVIGAGHNGLKQAMTWLTRDHRTNPFTNFVVYDRRPKVGGTSWWQQANVTSRLQTEVGVYHLQYHEDNGIPPGCQQNPWPSRKWLLDHFHSVSEEFGILPYCEMNTNVTRMNVIGKDYWDQYYELTLKKESWDPSGQVEVLKDEEDIVTCASISFYPGNLTNPKRVIYKGEELFDGDVVYGISSSFDYGNVKGHGVVIVGSGAFAVENVRTCVEYGATKISMVCRRKTLAMPRVVSWAINQTFGFLSAATTLTIMEPMYNLFGVDPWKYYAVFSNESKTNVTIRQKSRFGIGDVYFAAMAYGFCDHHVDDIKRVSYHKVHLNNGTNIDDVYCMLKLLGFNGEFENDRLVKLKELYGFWCNEDYRRYLVAEPLGVDANNFGGTSFSPGAISWTEQQILLLDFPKDWSVVRESQLLPRHKADESIDRPAYVVEARHGSLTSITLGSLVSNIADRGGVTGPLKHHKQLQCCPLEEYLFQCKKEWYDWCDNMEKAGADPKRRPEYPYTEDALREMQQMEFKDMQAKGRG